MSVVIDHCVPRKFLRLVQSWGYDASTITQHISSDSPDSAVIALAQQLDAVLLTVDMDFANILHYPPENYGGIIVMRYELSEEPSLITTLQNVFNDLYRDELRSAIVVVEPKRYRVRR